MDTSLEARVEALEKELATFRGEHSEHIRNLKASLAEVENLVRVEAIAREKGEAGLQESLKDGLVGGVTLELVGSIWFLLGMLGTSIPKVIANLIPKTLIL